MTDKPDTKIATTRTVRLPCGCTEIQAFNAAHELIRSSDDKLCDEHGWEQHWEKIAEERAEARGDRTSHY